MRQTLNLALVLSCSILSCAGASAAEPSAADLEFFEKKIRPVLVTHCYECHSAKSEEAKGGLLLDTREGIRRGGESGHGVVPGNLDDSLVLSALRYESVEMPPDQQLPETVIADFETWIKSGAADPREGASLVQRKIDFQQARSYWAYQPVTKPDVPRTSGKGWARNDIDRFVLARLEASGLSPSGDAEPLVLLRRIHFDLTGLPPTADDVQQFQADWQRAAAARDPAERAAVVERVIDRLLESPHFGERWGRHWLDVARYGESTGMERNFTFPHAWRYRDYVIEAFNADKPFDRFIREQLAGDLLPAESPEERLRSVVATGFLAIGPKSLNERNAEQFAMDVVDDQIDVTSRAFLGLTVACARCHDHKFDAIPQSEYYALAGIFRSTDTFYGTAGAQGNRQAGRLLKVDRMQVASVTPGGNQGKGGKANVKQLANQVRKLQTNVDRLKKSDTPAATKRLPRLEKQLAQARRQLAAARKQEPPAEAAGNSRAGDSKTGVLVMGVQDVRDPGDTQLRVRGEPNDLGDSVPRGFLTVATSDTVAPLPEDASGRLQLADWIASPDNPLTARVAVNRFWQHLFGRGLVASVNNLGNNGDKPTHPLLLDYLAADFMQEGWSVKRFIKSVMMSRTYQMSSAGDPRGEEVDPDNYLLWRQNQRRLDAESIRDAMLAASGNVDLQPADGSVVAQVGDGDVGRGIAPGRFDVVGNKRSVYLPIVRSAVPEALSVFDFPEPSIIAGQRDVTTVPVQALYMLNSPFVLAQAEGLAERVRKESDTRSGRMERLFLLTLGRAPSESEQARLEQFLKETQEQASAKSDDTAWARLCHVLLASAEFRYIQ